MVGDIRAGIGGDQCISGISVTIGRGPGTGAMRDIRLIRGIEVGLIE